MNIVRVQDDVGDGVLEGMNSDKVVTRPPDMLQPTDVKMLDLIVVGVDVSLHRIEKTLHEVVYIFPWRAP
jgi:hypothetical protein